SAEAILADLLRTDADNPEVLANARAFYQSSNQLPKLIDILEAERTRHPDNRVAIEQLVDIYVSQKHLPEASRVLDAARKTAGRDPDLIYYLAHLYERIDQRDTCEQMLQEVLTIDPRHAAANNDLGYTWADQNKNLDRAEQLIRVALDEEPDNE